MMVSWHWKTKPSTWHGNSTMKSYTEFPWKPDSLSQIDRVSGQPLEISPAMIEKALDKMKNGKAPGPSGIVAEMLKAAGEVGNQIISDRANAIREAGKRVILSITTRAKAMQESEAITTARRSLNKR